jgi:hypothetical protein
VYEDGFPSGDLNILPDSSTDEEREANPCRATATITAADGTIEYVVMHTAIGYIFSSVASVEAAKRVLGGQVIVGLQTSMSVFGGNLIESVLGSKRRTLKTSGHRHTLFVHVLDPSAWYLAPCNITKVVLLKRLLDLMNQ